MGIQRFKEWLGVLVVNDVKFSYRSFFSREVLGKRRGLSTSCELLYELNSTSYHNSLKSF
jgi:hypothetical protein